MKFVSYLISEAAFRNDELTMVNLAIQELCLGLDMKQQAIRISPCLSSLSEWRRIFISNGEHEFCLYRSGHKTKMKVSHGYVAAFISGIP